MSWLTMPHCGYRADKAPRLGKWRCDVSGGTPGISLCHAVMTGPPSVTQFVTPEPCHHPQLGTSRQQDQQIEKHLDNILAKILI